jgi:predicted RNA-binding protein YlxR (DUF448 family)
MSQDKPASPPVTTFANPEGIAVLVAAGLTAAVAAMPVIVVPGVLAYGILTVLRYNRWKDRQRSSQFDPLSFDLTKLRAPYSTRVTTCVELQSRVLGEIARAEPLHRTMLLPSVDRVRSLATAAFGLAGKLQQIQEYLSVENPGKLDGEGVFLRARVQSAQDAVAKERYERAYDQHRKKVEVYQELQARWERIDAQLTNIQLTLETAAAQVLRIKSAEAGTASYESVRVIESLEALSIDVQSLAETVEETAEATGSLAAHTLRAGK